MLGCCEIASSNFKQADGGVSGMSGMDLVVAAKRGD